MIRLSCKIRAVVLGAVAGFYPACVLEAQVASQVNQVEQVQRVNELQGVKTLQPDGGAVPSLYPGEEKDTGNQLLLEAAPQQRWQWFDLSLDSQYFYTSNALLNDTVKKATGLLVSTADASLAAPPITVPDGQLFLRTGFQYQWFNYGLGGPDEHLTQLDFDVTTVHVEGRYELPDQWAIVGSLAYTRLLSESNDYGEFYKELVPALRLEKVIQIRNDLQFSVGYVGDYRFTDEVPFPEQSRACNNRTDQALDLILAWQVAPKVVIRPFYRFQYSYYPDYFAGHSRNDFLNTFGLSAEYSFNSWSSVRVFLTYDIGDSDASSVPNYHKLDVGGGLSAGLKF